MRSGPRSSSNPESANLEQALLVEQHHAEWFQAERVVPGAEVHQDKDVTWILHAGQAWRNAGIMVRFSPSTALLATSEGYQVYARRGFIEVARFGYWYRSFQRRSRR